MFPRVCAHVMTQAYLNSTCSMFIDFGVVQERGVEHCAAFGGTRHAPLQRDNGIKQDQSYDEWGSRPNFTDVTHCNVAVTCARSASISPLFLRL
jgi:hypothetical protein